MKVTTKPKKQVEILQKRIAKEKVAFVNAYRKQWTVTGAAREIEKSRVQCSRWLKNDEEFREEVNVVKREHIDHAVSELVKLLQAGNLGAIIYFLKCQSDEWRPAEKREISGEIKSGIVQRMLTPREKKEAATINKIISDYERGGKKKKKHPVLDKERQDKE